MKLRLVIDFLNKEENTEFEENLKIAVIHSYRDSIGEWYKIKKFIRDFGLLNDLAIVSMQNQVLTTQKLNLNNNHFSLFQKQNRKLKRKNEKKTKRKLVVIEN